MHVVIGAGAVGTATARQLVKERSESVRLITRSGSGPRLPGIELVAADATDPARLTRLTTGATAIYNCANPRYHRWPTDWPPLAAALLAAAEASGAPLVIAGNLYGYGPVDRPMTEDQPLLPTTVKGKVRVRMWQDALAAHRAGRIRVTEVRASDFISPRHSLLEQAVPAMRAGRTVWLPVPLDVPHSFSYTGDLARTMIVAATTERSWGRAWHVPSAPALTVRELLVRAAQLGGFAPPVLRRFPALVVRTAGLVNPFVREFLEMRYQYERPYLLDATATRAALGVDPTPLDDALRATLEQFAPAGSRV